MRPDNDDPETNSKRVMLVGTALLTMIDLLVSVGLFAEDSVIRNIGFVLGLYLDFAVQFDGSCDNNEDGWRYVVVRKANEHGVKICGVKRIEYIVKTIQLDIDVGEDEEEHKDEDEKSEDEESAESDDRPNFLKAYKPAPYHPFGSGPGVPRSWKAWDWGREVCAPFARY